MRKDKIILATLLGMFLLPSCSSEEPGGRDVPDDSEGVGSIALLAEESAAVKELSDFNDRFFAAFCSEFSDDDNYVVSPLSASMFLSLASNAASEDAQKEIMDVLGVKNSSALNGLNHKLLTQLPTLAPKVNFTLANSVWYEKAFTLSPEFGSLAKDSYLSELTPCDMYSGSRATLNLINDWASQKTGGLIPTFLNDLPEETEAVILNALYFNGKWAQTFTEAETAKATFHGAKADAETEMMHKEETMKAAATDNYTVVCKPFAGNRFQAYFVLPDEGTDVDRLISSGIIGKSQALSYTDHIVDFTMPKFKYAPKDEYKLNEVLETMGVTKLLNDENTRLFTPARDLRCEVAQKTYLEFTEQGAKAASVTGSNFDIAVAYERMTVALDRPFIFYITETTSGVCLFAGKITQL